MATTPYGYYLTAYAVKSAGGIVDPTELGSLPVPKRAAIAIAAEDVRSDSPVQPYKEFKSHLDELMADYPTEEDGD